MNKKEFELVGDLLREKRENDEILKLFNNKVNKKDRNNRIKKVSSIYVRFYYSETCCDYSSFETNKSIQKLLKEAYIKRQEDIKAQLKKLGYED